MHQFKLVLILINRSIFGFVYHGKNILKEMIYFKKYILKTDSFKLCV
jgi:hypothetical protein